MQASALSGNPFNLVFLFMVKNTVSTIALHNLSITGTETLLPISFIHLALDSGNLNSGGNPCIKQASLLVIFLNSLD